VALSFPDVIKSKYLLLTTFTKDGRPNTPRVTIAKSAALGKPKSEEVEAVARVLPKSETRRVYNAVLKRYWYHAWWFYAHSIVRGGIDKVHVGLEVKPAE
jgi:PPOX class probable F420-dependent enzyme